MYAYGGLRVVEPGNNRGVEDRDALSDWLGWVIQQRGQVGVFRETEAGHALLRAVGDQEGAIGKWRLQAA